MKMKKKSVQATAADLNVAAEIKWSIFCRTDPTLEFLNIWKVLLPQQELFWEKKKHS